MWTKLLGGTALSALAAYCTIVLSQALFHGVFPILWVFADFGLAIGLALAASVVFWATAICSSFLNIQKPGIILFTVMTTFAGAVAIWCGAALFPAWISVSGFAAALGIGYINSLMIWLMAISAGEVQKNLTLWPVFKSK